MPSDSLAQIMGLVKEIEEKGQAGAPRAGTIPTTTGEVEKDSFPVEKWEPKRLTPKHRQILSLYAQGMKRYEVAAFCRVTPAMVTLLAKSEKGKAYLSEIEEHMDGRLRALYSRSVDAIEDQLVNGKGENKLKAAALQMKATGKLGQAQEDQETAEDVIQRIMQMNVQVNHYHGPAVPAPKVIEGE